MDTITGSGGGSIGTTYYYAEDFLGSSRAMVQAGAMTPCFDADFLPFGREKDAVATCTQNAYKFEGKERDAETGNDDFGARYYSSNFGRWLSPDWSSTPEAVPYANLTNPQTLNLYAMVQDNPESFADLDGHVNTTATASQTVTCDVIDTQGCNYYQVGWIFAITNSPSEPGSHDITALANKINLWSLPSWPYALTFTPKIAVAQCLHDIAKCQQAPERTHQGSTPQQKTPTLAGPCMKQACHSLKTTGLPGVVGFHLDFSLHIGIVSMSTDKSSSIILNAPAFGGAFGLTLDNYANAKTVGSIGIDTGEHTGVDVNLGRTSDGGLIPIGETFSLGLSTPTPPVHGSVNMSVGSPDSLMWILRADPSVRSVLQ